MTGSAHGRALALLLVEDSDPDAELVEEILGGEPQPLTVTRVTRLGQATDVLREAAFDCVLLDLGLPDSHGIETLTALRAKEAAAPVIVLTGLDDEALGISALREGAQDYLVKGQVDGRMLLRAVQHAIERKALDEARSQFIARAAHELRTPMAVLAGLGETVASRFDELPAEERAEILVALRRQASRARTLIAQLLDLSQAELGRMHLQAEHLEVSELVATAVDAAEPPEELTVDIAVESGLRVLGDRSRIEQIITNLVTNAYRHGGHRVSVSAERDGDAVVISVADDGPGVADGVRAHMFEPFMRGAPASDTEGAGLGLAISRRLAEVQNGDLRLVDTPSGACFVLTLPS